MGRSEKLPARLAGYGELREAFGSASGANNADSSDPKEREFRGRWSTGLVGVEALTRAPPQLSLRASNEEIPKIFEFFWVEATPRSVPFVRDSICLKCG